MEASVAAVDELRRIVRAKVTQQGRTVSALPGLWFFRHDRPRQFLRVASSSMYVGVALQGRKSVRVGSLELTYDSLSYLVMAGETEYDASVVTATAGKRLWIASRRSGERSATATGSAPGASLRLRTRLGPQYPAPMTATRSGFIRDRF